MPTGSFKVEGVLERWTMTVTVHFISHGGLFLLSIFFAHTKRRKVLMHGFLLVLSACIYLFILCILFLCVCIL